MLPEPARDMPPEYRLQRRQWKNAAKLSKYAISPTPSEPIYIDARQNIFLKTLLQMIPKKHQKYRGHFDDLRGYY